MCTIVKLLCSVLTSSIELLFSDLSLDVLECNFLRFDDGDSKLYSASIG